jgi:hypothetical protein
MSRAMSKVVLAAAVFGLTSVAALAQQSTTSETKTFEVLSVQGNQLVVSLPEGTRELTVPDDFRFTVNGQQLSVRDLRPGMKGTATITTRTTVTPVSVTQVKNGTVAYAAGGTIIVRTDEGVRSFTQGDVDKRGVKIMRAGKPAQVSDFRQGDRLSATIITSMPPKVLTEQEVQATMASASTSSPARASGPPSTPLPANTASAAPARPAGEASAPARTLPKTASPRPLIQLVTVLALAMGLALTIRRRLVA